jgi:hypothetical protein
MTQTQVSHPASERVATWARENILAKPERLNTRLLLKDLYADFKNYKSSNNISRWDFDLQLKAFCAVQGWTVNPAEMTNRYGRILSIRVLETGAREVVEQIFIKS